VKVTCKTVTRTTGIGDRKGCGVADRKGAALVTGEAARAAEKNAGNLYDDKIPAL